MPQFQIVRREVVDTIEILEGTNGMSPLEAGFMSCARYFSKVQDDANLEFELDGMLFSANRTWAPERNVPAATSKPIKKPTYRK
jgi:hypothetical protein